MTQKEDIVEQTMQMFVTQGIKSVRMDDIASQLGISKRTLYELFADKEELIYLSLQRYLTKRHEHWAALTSRASNLLEAFFIGVSDAMDHGADVHRIIENLCKFHPAVYTRLSTEFEEYSRKKFKVFLQQGVDEGLILGTIDIDLMIAVLFLTITGLTRNKDFPYPTYLTPRQVSGQIITSFIRGISTERGLALVDACLQEYENDLTRRTPLAGTHKPKQNTVKG